MGTRDEAVISGIKYDEERGTTVHIMCEGRDSGWGQGFGGYHLQNTATRREFVADICAAFGVADPELLIGKPCYVLRCFDEWGATIEGLESEETGRRFIASDWCRKRWPENTRTPLEQRIESLESTARWANRRAEDARRELLTVRERYVDWSDEPPVSDAAERSGG